MSDVCCLLCRCLEVRFSFNISSPPKYVPHVHPREASGLVPHTPSTPKMPLCWQVRGCKGAAFGGWYLHAFAEIWVFKRINSEELMGKPWLSFYQYRYYPLVL